MRLPLISRPSSAVARSAPAKTPLLQRLLALPRPRPRARQLEDHMAWIGLRDVSAESLASLERELARRALEVPGVVSVAINPYLRRARFHITPGRVSLEQLETLVIEAELACRTPGTELSAERELPDDELLHLQRWVELLADSAGLGLGAMLRLLPFLPTALSTNAAALLTLIRTQPRLRAPLDRKLGKDRADLALGVMLAFCQGLSQRPLSLWTSATA